jgi:hypothetical protein
MSTDRLLSGLKRRPGITEGALRELAATFGQAPIPPDYLALLRESDGAEGSLGHGSYIALWSAEELRPLNKEYAVNEFAPGFMLFGTDGGNNGYAFDLRNQMRIVELPLVGMDPDSAVPLAATVSEFLRRLASG